MDAAGVDNSKFGQTTKNDRTEKDNFMKHGHPFIEYMATHEQKRNPQIQNRKFWKDVRYIRKYVCKKTSSKQIENTVMTNIFSMK